MSLLGFDALGRWALGQIPNSRGFALVAVRASFTFSGQAAGFRPSGHVDVAGCLATGTAASFRIAEPTNPGSFAMAGNVAAFTSQQTSLGGSLLATGAPGNWLFQSATLPAAVLLSGTSLRFSTSLSSYPCALTWAGSGSSYSRDHEAWVPRPFDAMSWQTAATVSPQTWSDAVGAANAWAVDVQPESTWTPASIEPETWTTE